MPYYGARRNVRQPEEKALSFAHAFLGVRIQCAQCHKHPFDQWTQQDFKKFQAFFEPIQYKANTPRGDKGDGAKNYQSLMNEIEKSVGYDKEKKTNRKELRSEIKRRAQAGEAVPWQELYIANPKSKPSRNKSKNKKRRYSGRVITPSVLGARRSPDRLRRPATTADGLAALRGNPYFARAFVNRVWHNYFGRGIVEPVDDMNLANPPPTRHCWTTSPTASSERLRHEMAHRTILNSDTYQRSWRPNEPKPAGTSATSAAGSSGGSLPRWLPTRYTGHRLKYAGYRDVQGPDRPHHRPRHVGRNNRNSKSLNYALPVLANRTGRKTAIASVQATPPCCRRCSPGTTPL
ncbi:MAG: hypothetical protein CM1200mP34_4860 [Verrucomicrobiales bacterium]|nr:MAG: hypothetical protein CM1200mP34_4860 [Verrucomicrobiales bacterium]